MSDASGWADTARPTTASSPSPPCGADERLYYPLHAEPYTPASHFTKKQADPKFRTKLQIAVDLIAQALAADVVCRAVVADSFYGDHDPLRGQLSRSGLGFVMALKPSRGSWQYGAEAYTPERRRPGRAVGRARRSRRLAPGAANVP